MAMSGEGGDSGRTGSLGSRLARCWCHLNCSLVALIVVGFLFPCCRKLLMLACRPSSRRALPTSLPSKISCWLPSTFSQRPSRPGTPPS